MSDPIFHLVLDLTSIELSSIKLGIEDRITELKDRIAYGCSTESMEHRRRWLAAAESVLEKLEKVV